MRTAFQTWTPRVRRLAYDSLLQDIGCQSISGNDVFASQAFERICIAEHDPSIDPFSQSPLISYAIGPANTGNPPPWITPWAAWVSTTGIRVGKFSEITLPSSGIGSPSGLYAGLSPLPPHLSLGFTPEAQMGIAIQSGAEIRIKWFKDSDGTYGDETFTGFSPALFGNAAVYSSELDGETDLVLYYLNPASPKSIFARFQREEFLVEHLIHDNLPVPLSRLISSESLDGRQYLYALDNLGRDVTLRSPVYIINAGHDKSTLLVEFARGSYQEVAILRDVLNEPATLTISIEKGSYNDVIVEPDDILSGDQGSLTVAVESGVYA